jgi:hypothetical protein
MATKAPKKTPAKKRTSRADKAKAADIVLIEIPPIEVGVLRVRVEGISPLICHQFSEKTKQILIQKAMRTATKQREPKDPEAEFQGARYRIDRKGKYVKNPGKQKLADAVPARYFKEAMVQAARHVPSISMVEAQQLAYISPNAQGIPIETRNGKGWITYGIDVQPEIDESVQRVGGKGPGTGAPDIRYRPVYDPWSCLVEVHFNAKLLGESQIVALLNYAGFHAGVCEHRPSKSRSGQNGMFRVTEVS